MTGEKIMKGKVMSHYSVAIFHKPNQNINKMMAPYDENREISREEMVFRDCTDNLRRSYNNNTIEAYELRDGRIVSPISDELYVTTTKEKYRDARKNGTPVKRTKAYGKMVYLMFSPLSISAKKVNVTANKVFTFIQYCRYFEYEREKNRWGYYSNPLAKWDWWEFGGRWDGLLKLKDGAVGENGKPGLYGRSIQYDGKHVSRAYVKDVDFSLDQEKYNHAIRWWEVIVENSPLKPGENKNDFFNMYNIEYLKNRYHTKEQYAEERATFTTFAVITPDGKWHAPGRMGWFATTDCEDGAEEKWAKDYKKNFVDPCDEDTMITIVDCHT